MPDKVDDEGTQGCLFVIFVGLLFAMAIIYGEVKHIREIMDGNNTRTISTTETQGR